MLASLLTQMDIIIVIVITIKNNEQHTSERQRRSETSEICDKKTNKRITIWTALSDNMFP